MRRLSIGTVLSADQETFNKWVETSLRSIERASFVNNAEDVLFDQSTSDIEADNVQDALVELDAEAVALSSQVAALSSQVTVLSSQVTGIVTQLTFTGDYGINVIAAEALSAGSFVGLGATDNSPRLVLADASDSKIAIGFVTQAYSSGSTATFYVMGFNNNISGISGPAAVYLSSNAGGVTDTLPSTSNLRQFLGISLSSASMFVYPFSFNTDPSGLSS